MTTRNYLVTLTCNCTIKLKEKPYRANATYTCPNNMGHGYVLGWIDFTDMATGFRRDNPMAGAKRPEEQS